MRYKFKAEVAQVEQRFRSRYVSGIGKDAIFEKDSMGYYARFVGSWEALFVGFELPEFKRGDKVSIWVEKETE